MYLELATNVYMSKCSLLRKEGNNSYGDMSVKASRTEKQMGNYAK